MTVRRTEVRPRPEGGGSFAPALGGGSGANRVASAPGAGRKDMGLSEGSTRTAGWARSARPGGAVRALPGSQAPRAKEGKVSA